jgi:hypothetical protein
MQWQQRTPKAWYGRTLTGLVIIQVWQISLCLTLHDAAMHEAVSSLQQRHMSMKQVQLL